MQLHSVGVDHVFMLVLCRLFIDLFGLGMLTSLDRDESLKNSRAREKISQQQISRPEICTRTDVGIEVSANETRCLCSLPAVDV